MECRNPNSIQTSPELKDILNGLPEGHIVTGTEPPGECSGYVLKESFRSKLCGHIPPSVECHYHRNEERIRVTITEFPSVKEARNALLSASSWFFNPMIKSEFSVSSDIGDAAIRSDRMLSFVRHNVTVQISASDVKEHITFANEMDSEILKK
jgi:hypothetical protein